MNNFNRIAFSPLCRMNEIKRYSSVHQETEETLAEHVAEVSMMSYIIAHDLKVLGEEINIESLLVNCLFHDVDETVTGDVPRNTKYASKEAHQQLNEVAESAVDLIEVNSGVSFKSFWKNSKVGKEGVILKISDMLVVVKKTITEVELRNNLSFLKVVIELERHLKVMINDLSTYSSLTNKESYDYMINLVNEAKDEIVKIRLKYSHIIDRYSLKENVIGGE